MYFRALYDYFSGCSFLSVISSLLNFSGYCIITLVVSIILCQYQFALFDINYLSGHCVSFGHCVSKFLFLLLFLFLTCVFIAVRLALLFTARCTLVQSAVLPSHVVCLSAVSLSVCDVGEL